MVAREWGRISEKARLRLDHADVEPITEMEAMCGRHGYTPEDALVWVRVPCTMQNGCYALEIREPMEMRLALAPHYLEALTGLTPGEEELAAFRAYAMSDADARKFDDLS